MRYPLLRRVQALSERLRSRIVLRRERVVAAGYVVGFALIAAAALPIGADASRDAVSVANDLVELDIPVPAREWTTAAARNEETPAVASPGSNPAALDDEGWQLVEVRSGDTLGAIFTRLGFSHRSMHRFMDGGASGKALVRLRPGQQLAFLRGDQGDLEAVRFDRDESTRIVLELVDNAVRERTLDRPLERRVRFAQGIIERSLFDAGQQAGLSDPLILRMAQVLGFDIDFALDLRQGDTFAVIYDEIYREGEFLRGGDIIAVTFINRGKRFDGIRHELEDGRIDYYAADGRPLRRAFIRTPVDFTRISSRFSLGRKHPILGRMRAHRGVDYAAPSGTPVKAAGNGRVVERGAKGGYGQTVVIDHGNRITTLYAHLSRYAPNLRVGSRVQQGQTIGYVGMTGLATGPHLHYEFRVSGTHRDPLSIDLPAADPLSPRELLRFRQSAAPLLAHLELLQGSQIAIGP